MRSCILVFSNVQEFEQQKKERKEKEKKDKDQRSNEMNETEQEEEDEFDDQSDGSAENVQDGSDETESELSSLSERDAIKEKNKAKDEKEFRRRKLERDAEYEDEDEIERNRMEERIRKKKEDVERDLQRKQHEKEIQDEEDKELEQQQQEEKEMFSDDYSEDEDQRLLIEFEKVQKNYEEKFGMSQNFSKTVEQFGNAIEIQTLLLNHRLQILQQICFNQMNQKEIRSLIQKSPTPRTPLIGIGTYIYAVPTTDFMKPLPEKYLEFPKEMTGSGMFAEGAQRLKQWKGGLGFSPDKDGQIYPFGVGSSGDKEKKRQKRHTLSMDQTDNTPITYLFQTSRIPHQGQIPSNSIIQLTPPSFLQLPPTSIAKKIPDSASNNLEQSSLHEKENQDRKTENLKSQNETSYQNNQPHSNLNQDYQSSVLQQFSHLNGPQPIPIPPSIVHKHAGQNSCSSPSYLQLNTSLEENENEGKESKQSIKENIENESNVAI
ncbi:MAG: hypothetical protein EZS28_017397, partial [Streblomastix strix]